VIAVAEVSEEVVAACDVLSLAVEIDDDFVVGMGNLVVEVGDGVVVGQVAVVVPGGK
jgi:carbonic anhydrase/acetyltransferase-like protein (isoleucine patch superfamily)